MGKNKIVKQKSPDEKIAEAGSSWKGVKPAFANNPYIQYLSDADNCVTNPFREIGGDLLKLRAKSRKHRRKK